MGRHYLVGNIAYDETNAAAVEHGTPVVVIDPEDREQARHLAHVVNTEIEAIPYKHTDYADELTKAGQRALRSLIQPPKPPEPTNRYAVVLDADDVEWLRSRDGLWCYSKSDGTRASWVTKSWSAITAVRVLSEGVPS